MRSQDFGKVRRGDYIIFADPYEGVFKALVKNIDIRIRDEDVPGGYSYPYGLTSEDGTVEIEVAGTRRIVNLEDLIKWAGSRFNELVRMWATYQARKNRSDEALDVFKELRAQFKEAF